jgi:PAS domain S-box-containing protein
LFYEGTVADISVTVAAQQALEQSERLYRSLVENCRDGVFLMQHGIIVFCNEALARSLDFSAEELIGTSYFDRIAEDDRIEQQRRRQQRESGSDDVQAFEIHLLRKDGQRRLFEVRADSVEYHGAPASIGTMRDVTETRAQQQRIVDAEERYRLALWGSGDHWFDWDLASGNLLTFRPSLKIEPPLVVKVSSPDDIAAYVHPDDFDGYRRALVDHLAGRSGHFETSYRLRNRAGEWCWKLGRGMVVARDANGVALRISGTQKDISRIKQVETDLLDLTRDLDARVQARTRELQEERLSLQEANAQLMNALDELRRAQRELTESERMASLGRLVAGVAHEVNTPLGVGLTAISFLRVQLNELKAALVRQFPAERIDSLIGSLESAGAMTESNLLRAAELVRSFKQVAVDQSTRSIRSFGVRDYLQEIMRSLHPALKRSRHQFLLECDETIQATSRTDAIYQIVVNLVMNSILHGYAGDERGVLKISVEPQGQLLRLRYEDDGRGMDADTAERVFEPFFTTRRESGGTGLGMHIVYNLVTQALAGRITLATAPGKGVRFDVVFPRIHPGSGVVVAR